MKTTIKITDPQNRYFGQELEGYCIYYDIFHRGGTSEPVIDLFRAHTPEGKKIQLYSNQLDVPHYEAQLLQEVIEKIGANVGDKVIIKRMGSGSWGKFDFDAPHVITKIDSSGHVEFDNGKANGFQPDVEIYKED